MARAARQASAKGLCRQLRRLLGDDAIDEALRLVALRCVEARGLQAPQGLELFAPRRSDAGPPGLQAARELLRRDESAALFREPDLLGWIYQHWQQPEREALFERVLGTAAEKIRGREILAATQLYTPRAMAQFLVQNSLGATWSAMLPASGLPRNWSLFARRAQRLPLEAREPCTITVLDPACGTGNLLLEALDRLFEIYGSHDNRLTPAEICTSILEHNLFGIDLDRRAVAVARAALWMRAAELAPGLPPVQPNLICLDAPLADAERHLQAFQTLHPDLADRAPELEALFTDLGAVDVIGSLLGAGDGDPQPWISRVIGYLSEHGELGTALGWLTQHHDVVVTNPPYLSNRRQGDLLRKHLRTRFPATAADLYGCFVQRLEQLTREGGFYAVVAPQGWTTLKSFARFRRRWLENNALSCFLSLGQHAFVDAPLLYIGLAAAQRRRPPPGAVVTAFRRVDNADGGLDDWLATLCRDESHGTAGAVQVPQALFADMPGAAITPFLPERLLAILSRPAVTIGDRAEVVAGIDSGENRRFLRRAWEIAGLSRKRFRPYSKGKGLTRWSGTSRAFIDWQEEGAVVRAHPGSTIRNAGHHFRPGLEYSYVYGGKVSCRVLAPAILDHGSAGVFARSAEDEALILGLLNSRLGTCLGRTLSPTLNLPVGAVTRFPLPRLDPSDRWFREIAALVRACLSVKQWLDDRLEPADRTGQWEREAPGDTARLPLVSSAAVLHLLEGALEETLHHAFDLDADARAALFRETGRPPGSTALTAGYVALPPRPNDADTPALQRAWQLAAERLEKLPGGDAAEETLDATRARLAEQWALRPGLAPGRAGRRGAESDRRPARPLPPTTWLEDPGLELNPVSLYWLLAEGIEQQGWGSDAAEQEAMIAWASAAVLDLLADADGLLQLRPEGGGSQLLDHVPRAAAAAFEAALGRPLRSWLADGFFAAHVKRFERRPVAWQLRAGPPSGKGRSATLDCLVDFRRLEGRSPPLTALRTSIVPALRARGGLGSEDLDVLSRFAADLDLALEWGFDFDGLRDLLAEEPLDRFCSPDGRAKPPTSLDEFLRQEARYHADRNQGVRVNIAPLQRAGLLTAVVLRRDDVDRAIADRARYRADERRLCRAGKLKQPGWWPPATDE